MESIGVPAWQAATLAGILVWVMGSSALDISGRFVRPLIRPWIECRVAADTPHILRIQRWQNGFLDTMFSILSCMVSVPFYTGFIPFLFWSGHSKLGRQMIILLSSCDYVGNSIKDMISAPRPCCPPVRRVTATEDEKENAMEYGLPSSHALNTVCLVGYLLYYGVSHGLAENATVTSVAFALSIFLVILIGIGRIYLGMHSFVDVLAGICFGLIFLAFWLVVHEYVDDFIVSGQNVISFCAGLSFLLCFAYPTPEIPTPSFEYHTAFNSVTFGILSGAHQTYHQFHNDNLPRFLTGNMPTHVILGRLLIGIPTILLVKFCSKAIAKWLLPVMCNTLGIPIKSSCYLPTLKESENGDAESDMKHSGYFRKTMSFFPQKIYDVDTGIRFIQYAGLGWAVADLVPSLFSHLKW